MRAPVRLAVVVAVLSAVLPYSLELAALRRLPTRTVGVLAGLEPASAGLAGVLVLGERLSGVQWLALACVGAASAGTVVRRGRGGTRRRSRPVRGASDAGRQKRSGERCGSGAPGRTSRFRSPWEPPFESPVASQVTSFVGSVPVVR